MGMRMVIVELGGRWWWLWLWLLDMSGYDIREDLTWNFVWSTVVGRGIRVDKRGRVRQGLRLRLVKVGLRGVGRCDCGNGRWVRSCAGCDDVQEEVVFSL